MYSGPSKHEHFDRHPVNRNNAGVSDSPPRELASSIVWDAGVHVENTLLWFDPKRPRDFAVVTGPRKHLGARQMRVLRSERTARLSSAFAGKKVPGLATPFGRTVNLGNLQIELFPSGYVAGGASVLVTLPTGQRLIHSGAFSWTRNASADVIETRTADTLILDATYGAPRYRFPDRDSVGAALIAWLQGVLESGGIPVLLVGCPGKAQDLALLLTGAGLSLRVHRLIRSWNRAYGDAGISIPEAPQFRGHPARGEVLLWPAHLRRSTAIRNLRGAQFAACTGAALDVGAEKRLKVNVVFPWSARADHDGLIRYADATRAREIVVVGREADTLAQSLQRPGRTVSVLRESRQIPLL